MNNLKSIGVPAIDGLATRIWTACGVLENIMALRKIRDKKSKASPDANGKDQQGRRLPDNRDRRLGRGPGGL